jgi:hypothetical protein
MLYDAGFDWLDMLPEKKAAVKAVDGGDVDGAEDEGVIGRPRGLCSRRPHIPRRTTHALALMPSRMLSRVWGKFNSIPIPMRARAPIYRSYSWAFGVNLDEVR